MGDTKFHFEQAYMDETLYIFNDSANVRSSINNINSAPGSSTVVVYRPANSEELEAEAATTLQNIISAVKIPADALTKINSQKPGSLHIQQIINLHQPSYLICFGIAPHELGIHIHAEKYIPFIINGITMVFGDGVEKLDKPLKNRLWTGLQKMYGLK